MSVSKPSSNFSDHPIKVGASATLASATAATTVSVISKIFKGQAFQSALVSTFKNIPIVQMIVIPLAIGVGVAGVLYAYNSLGKEPLANRVKTLEDNLGVLEQKLEEPSDNFESTHKEIQTTRKELYETKLKLDLAEHKPGAKERKLRYNLAIEIQDLYASSKVEKSSGVHQSLKAEIFKKSTELNNLIQKAENTTEDFENLVICYEILNEAHQAGIGLSRDLTLKNAPFTKKIEAYPIDEMFKSSLQKLNNKTSTQALNFIRNEHSKTNTLTNILKRHDNVVAEYMSEAYRNPFRDWL